MAVYHITRKCMECGVCKMRCPRRCIKSGTPFYIEYNKCDACGLCCEICPYGLIEKQEDSANG